MPHLITAVVAAVTAFLSHFHMHTAEASWYEDAGETACQAPEGGTLHYARGFASRTLPCGTKVLFHHGRHWATGRVQDRGPFIYSRLFDFNAGLRYALRCPELCTVGYRVL